jgi:hypothetical protein
MDMRKLWWSDARNMARKLEAMRCETIGNLARNLWRSNVRHMARKLEVKQCETIGNSARKLEAKRCEKRCGNAKRDTRNLKWSDSRNLGINLNRWDRVQMWLLPDKQHVARPNAKHQSNYFEAGYCPGAQGYRQRLVCNIKNKLLVSIQAKIQETRTCSTMLTFPWLISYHQKLRWCFGRKIQRKKIHQN